jgi:hypothetical protein
LVLTRIIIRFVIRSIIKLVSGSIFELIILLDIGLCSTLSLCIPPLFLVGQAFVTAGIGIGGARRATKRRAGLSKSDEWLVIFFLEISFRVVLKLPSLCIEEHLLLSIVKEGLVAPRGRERCRRKDFSIGLLKTMRAIRLMNNYLSLVVVGIIDDSGG